MEVNIVHGDIDNHFQMEPTRAHLCIVASSMGRRGTSLLSVLLCSATLPARAEPEVEPGASAGDAIVITATRSPRRLADVPVATEVITRQDIIRSGAENAADALENHAAIDVVRSLGSAAVRLQGLDPDYVLILVDGQRVTGRLDGAIDMKRFAAQDIERIEIVRGAGSALYGSDAIAGIINIITRRPVKPFQADVHAGYGSRHELDLSASAGARGGVLSSRVSGGFHRADAYDLSPDDPATNGGSFDDSQASLNVQVDPADWFELRADAAYRQRNQHAVDQGAGGALFDREQRNDEWRLSLQPRLNLNASDALTVSAHYNQVRDHYQRDQRRSDALDQDERTDDRLFEVTAQVDALLLERHMLTAGLEGSVEWLESERIAGGNAERGRLATYLQDEWRVLDAPALSLVPGMRVDVDSEFGAYPTPKLTVRLDPNDELVLRASYGFAFRAPDFKQQFLRFENPGVGYVVEGNPELDPETARSINAGVEYEALSWLWLATDVYRTDLDDMIVAEPADPGTEPGTQVYRYVNIAAAHTQGFDVSVRAKTGFGLSVDLEYALTDSWDEENDRAIEGRALHRGSVQLGYQLRELGFDASASLLWVGSRPFYVDPDGDGGEETRDADPYATARVRLAQDLGKWLTLFVGVDNLFDAGNADDLPIAPRSFYAGLDARI
jgi:outer membrane receptor for ferrienterochelin and colicins